MQGVNILRVQFGHSEIAVSIRLPGRDSDIYKPARSLN